MPPHEALPALARAVPGRVVAGVRLFVQAGDARGKPPPYGHHSAQHAGSRSIPGAPISAQATSKTIVAPMVPSSTSSASCAYFTNKSPMLIGHFTAFPVKSESAPADLSAPSSPGAVAARSLTPTSGSGRFNLIFGGAAHARRALADAED